MLPVGEIPNTPCDERDVKSRPKKRVNGKTVWESRWVMAQMYGWAVVDKHIVEHACDNGRCVRFDHLRLGYQRQNMSDMKLKGRAHNSRKTHCNRGHLFDEENTYRHPDGQRECRECRRIVKRAWRAKQAET